MRKNGWGLSSMLYICLIMVVFLLVAIYFYHKGVKKYISVDDRYGNFSYIALEEKVVKAYIKYNNSLSEKIEHVTIDTLIEKGYLDKVVGEASISCTGYAKYLKGQGKAKGFIRCGNKYETLGYNKNLD